MKETSQKEEDSKGIEGAEVLLHVLVRTPHTQVFMRRALRTLDSDEVIALIRYLVTLLELFASNGEPNVRSVYAEKRAEMNAPPGTWELPTSVTVMEWFCLVVDSHLLTLATLPPAKSLVRRCLAVIMGYLDCKATTVAKVTNLLSCLRMKKLPIPRSKPPIYMIERMMLNN
eukprot:CAMPEP_0170173848 /NCGR_PEP_ID=MMETSP0040_2-20121228/7115_1 /TAXON_ID=641309 /ORGANISM="Lotharella oceanica, Strain CCMP622" /LENGTH=171 /DNA_ID=CAMNT_0010415227 /DNA_START=57 /DNA_END=572 /DNA_ORIENTATION=+